MDSFKNLTSEDTLALKMLEALATTKPEDVGAVKYKTAFGDMWIIPNKFAPEGRFAAVHVERQPILDEWPMKGLAKTRKVTAADLKRRGY